MTTASKTRRAAAGRTAAKAPTARVGAARISEAAAPPATPPPAAAAEAAVQARKPERPRKPKLVRDSFTIPKLEYAAIDELKLRAAKLGQPAKKSELLRAGLKTLAGLSDQDLLESLAQVPRVKTGRPAKA